MRASTTALLILLLGCSPREDTGEDTVTPDPEHPALELDPASLVFPVVDVGEDPAGVAAIQVTNRGERAVQVLDVNLTGDATAFEVSHPEPSELLLEPAHAVELEVRFDPVTDHESVATLELQTDDPEHPVVSASLWGLGRAPVASAADVSLGAVFLGCEATRPLHVVNLGSVPLTVDEVELVGSDAWSLDVSTLPAEVHPGEALALDVGYTPTAPGTDWSTARVRTDDPLHPELEVALESTGEAWDLGADTWTYQRVRSVDMLFTLDRSWDTLQYNAPFTSHSETLPLTLAELGVADYHLAVAIADDGCIEGPVPWVDATSTAAEIEAAFKVMSDIHENGGLLTEAGFTLAVNALDPALTGPGGCNEGLVRSEATLHVVHISDVWERSAELVYGDYLDWLYGLKTSDNDVRVHAVAGDYPSGCGSTEAGLGYYEATYYTGGLFRSICAADWTAHLEALATATYELTDTLRPALAPAVATLALRVDGEVAEGWTWDEEEGAVVIAEDHLPDEGATVELTYAVLPPTCD